MSDQFCYGFFFGVHATILAYFAGRMVRGIIDSRKGVENDS